MPKTAPFHSQGQSVHHDNSKCGPGSEVPSHNKQSGTGNKPLCDDCKALNRDGK